MAERGMTDPFFIHTSDTKVFGLGNDRLHCECGFEGTSAQMGEHMARTMPPDLLPPEMRP